MLKKLTEYGNNIREKMKATLRKIKKKLQRTISVGEEAGIQINNLEHKEEIHSESVQNEETRIQKKPGENKKTLGHLQTCRYLNHRAARRRRGRARN